MKNYECKDIRNVCLMGHGGSGKTSLVEAMLFLSGGTDRMGKVTDGNTVSDYDPEEIRRKISISTTVLPIEWKNAKINVIDTPGYFDFAGEVVQGLHGADSALIVLSAKDGVEVGVEKSFRYAKNRDLPTTFFISKLDEEHADYHGTFDELRSRFGNGVCPLMIPVEESGKRGYVDVAQNKFKTYDKSGKETVSDLPAALSGRVAELTEMLREAICEESDELMDKFFSGEPFSEQETLEALRKGVSDRKVFPVVCGSAYQLEAIAGLLDNIGQYMPAPGSRGPETAYDENDGEVKITYDPTMPTCSYIFKTIADPFVGKLSFFKIIAGSMKVNNTLINTTNGTSERISHIMSVKGKKNTEIESASAGDIIAVTRISSANTGDTFCDASRKVKFPPMQFPAPTLSKAVVATDKGSEEKVSAGLIKLKDEDPAFTFVVNSETKQQILSGIGESHLDVLASKVKSKFGVGIELIDPKVPYRETIRGRSEAEGKHKKQSGGSGQFGVVSIRFEPLTTGEEFEFVNATVGGSVPKEFVPAVLKGAKEAIQKGVLAGFPLIGVKATLFDGKSHPVDSKEIAFVSAAKLAFKIGIPQAKPALLEPVGRLSVMVPEVNVGDVMGDINKRRGRMLGMGPAEDEPGYTLVEADIPMAEMSDYCIALRAMTKARGGFTFNFDRYEEAPANIAQQVIAQFKSEDEDEDE